MLPAPPQRVWLWSLLLVVALGLSACPGCGSGTAPEPSTTEVKLLPLGDVPPELEAVRAELEATFPGMPVTVLPAEPLPADIHHEGTIYAELLMAHYRERGPGLLLLLDADLANQLYTAVYSQVDLPHGNAVLSLPRFRTLAGVMPKEGATLTEEAMDRSKVRAARQAVHSVGRLIGSFPCKEEHCIHHRSSTVDILDRADEVCERHQMILAALLDVVVKKRAAAAATTSEGETDEVASQPAAEEGVRPDPTVQQAAGEAPASEAGTPDDASN